MVAPPLGDKPGSGALPPAGPATGLVQPRALWPALCSPLSSTLICGPLARREEARVPQGPSPLTGSVNRGARPRPEAP